MTRLPAQSGLRVGSRRCHPQQQTERGGVDDAWILIEFIVVLGLIFVMAAWVVGAR